MAHDHIQDTLIYIISFDPQIIISTLQIKKKKTQKSFMLLANSYSHSWKW